MSAAMERLKVNNPLTRSLRSVCDKSGSRRRSRSSEQGSKVCPCPGLLLTREICDHPRNGGPPSLGSKLPDSRPSEEKAEEEHEAAKVQDIAKRLEELRFNVESEEHIRYALNSKFADGDVAKAIELLQIQQKAFTGIIQPYNPNTEMLGAENRGNVTCYLDALLFAMFAKLSAFECMLRNDSTGEPQRKLAALLRLWVNMLRSGKLIRVDMTELIQDALAECGWKDAKLLEQQDTSEAFAFITETLQLPLLTLQVDLFHHGKGDADDHKVVHERLLNLAVPPDPDGKGIKLEDCLEEYFNNRVDVLRDSVEENKSVEKGAPKSPIRSVPDDEDADAVHQDHIIEGWPLQRRWTASDPVAQSPVSVTSHISAKSWEQRPHHSRDRSTSIIQRIVVEEKATPADQSDDSLLQKAKKTGSTVVKAVTIPAWQFFRLIPWHATTNSEPKNDVDVARHFNQRPVLGICLKRYTMTEQGLPKRQNTLIDIPDSMRLPHFMVVDDINGTNPEQEANGLSQEYKLILQSVVCHRGDSVHSGHYVSLARIAPKLMTDNRRHDVDPPPDYEEPQWAKFDDLATGGRVTYVDDIKQSLRDEMPYLLFYQIVPMFDVSGPPGSSRDDSVTDPPSYDASYYNNDSAFNMMAPSSLTTPLESVSGAEQRSAVGEISRSASSYFDTTGSTLAASNGHCRGSRLSSDLELPPRLSIDDEHQSRRESLAFSEALSMSITSSNGGGLGGAPVGASSAVPAVSKPAFPDTSPSTPAVTPPDETPSGAGGDKTGLLGGSAPTLSTSNRLSRAAAKFTSMASGGGSKSRPPSQAGEGRISSTISRLGFSRPSKEPANGGSKDGAKDGNPTESNGSGSGVVLLPPSTADDQQYVTVEEEPEAPSLAVSGKEEKDTQETEKEKDKGELPQKPSRHHKTKGSVKDRNKSKNREEKKDKGKGRDKDKDREKDRDKDKDSAEGEESSGNKKHSLAAARMPDRECVVM